MAMAAEWFREAFGAGYRTAYAHRDAAGADAEVRGALALLALPAGARVLDCGCGWGRHLRALRAAGLDAVGVDRSATLLADARAETLPVARADWRHLPCGPAFDGVVSLFTSFGYGPTESDDARVLREMARVLRPAGRVLLDLPNPARVRAGLQPASVRECAGHRVHEVRALCDGGRRVEKRVAFERASGLRGWVESVRLYEVHELAALAAGAGLVVRQVAGGLAGEPFAPEAPRCVVRLDRP
jgi:SAM-dependent methyltransferase